MNYTNMQVMVIIDRYKSLAKLKDHVVSYKSIQAGKTFDDYFVKLIEGKVKQLQASIMNLELVIDFHEKEIYKSEEVISLMKYRLDGSLISNGGAL
jgi:hypothetical protein